jgi:CRP-like cAMP-binding protein
MPLFAGLSRDDLRFLATNLDEIDVPAGEPLIVEGRGNHVFYVIAEGEVDVTVGGQPRPPLRRGDFFGEISMLGPDPATATVTARTPLRVWVASTAQFMALKAHEGVMLRLKAAMGERLRADRRAGTEPPGGRP